MMQGTTQDATHDTIPETPQGTGAQESDPQSPARQTDSEEADLATVPGAPAVPAEPSGNKQSFGNEQSSGNEQLIPGTNPEASAQTPDAPAGIGLQSAAEPPVGQSGESVAEAANIPNSDDSHGNSLDDIAAANRNVVKDGTYVIFSNVGEGLVLDVASGSMDDDANVQIWPDNGSGAQRWNVSKDAKGYLTIVNAQSGKALDVFCGLPQPDTNVQQYRPNGLPAQKWVAIPDGHGGIVLRSGVSGDVPFALDVLFGRPEAGTNVQIYNANGLPAQSWRFVRYPDVPDAIRAYWDAHQELGRPLAPAVKSSDGSISQQFTNGTVINDPERAVSSDIWTRWTQEGGARGQLGEALDDIVVKRSDGGYEKRFAHGLIRTGNVGFDPVIAIGGDIYDYWLSHQGIGQPTSNRGDSVGNGHWQRFERGSVYESPSSGTHFVGGDILGNFIATGAEHGFLGYPIADESPLSGGSSQVFEHGQIHWSPSTGAHFTRGGIQNYWEANGWQDGWLGYPIGDEIYNLRDGGASQAFQNGHVFWSAASGSHAVYGAIRDQYAALAWENSSLGYPTSDEYDWGKGRAQNFQGGMLTWNGCGKRGWQNPGQYFQVSSCDVTVLQNGMFGFASPSRIGMSATREQAIEAMISRAYDYMGTRYVWDYALQPGVGVDCAGLVMQALYAGGLNISADYNPSNHWYDPYHSHDANNMAADGRFMHVGLGDRQRGDLITWPGHIAIYLGNDQIIEANVPAVRINSLWAYGTPNGVLRPFV
ncbi:RICIN domain-containing protein [Bifidobacterium vespertilionis]|nr:RICIN domain-containing protein [Bifidobacterium vespertilionis]